MCECWSSADYESLREDNNVLLLVTPSIVIIKIIVYKLF